MAVPFMTRSLRHEGEGFPTHPKSPGGPFIAGFTAMSGEPQHPASHAKPQPCYPLPMQVTFDIPDTLAAQLRAAGKDPARAALEAVLVEAYRTGQLYEGEIKRILGYGTRMEVHALLKEHNVPLNYDIEDLEQDRETMRWFNENAAAKAA